MSKLEKLFHDDPEEFEREVEDLMKSPTGNKCALCGKDILNQDEIGYPDSPECCKEHGFIDLCPEHQEWFWKNEDFIQDRCIQECYKVSKTVC